MSRTKKIGRPGVRDGYDRWAETYDATSNPLVALELLRGGSPGVGEPPTSVTS
jgi:hypothetical protein